MKHVYTIVLAALLSIGCTPDQEVPHKFITPVKFSDVSIDDVFWSPRLQKHKDVTMGVCIDQIENQTGRMRNFENAAKGEGQHSGIFYDDSDVYKALEGMAYSLQTIPDPELEAKCDEWIDKFAAAQLPDGYINTYYTLTGLDQRWKDMDRHEMYCAGHMIEAAVAYYNVTGKDKLLQVSERMVQHMMSVFGPGKRDWVPGHEEIELALVKLYQTTGKREYLEFADWLLGERGHGYGTFGDGRMWNPVQYQDVVPVREATDITGHAVRAMYLFCGMADVAAYTGDQGYIDALDRLWDDVALRNMYITGGIGQSKYNEGFTHDYSLPNLEAYCETCASVGMVFWNWRMNQLTGDSKYVDVLERAMYNGALAGISLEGDKFFYVNPLESLGDHHRKSWYGTACCPSQICRFLPSIGNYIYGVSDDAVWVNLFISGSAEIPVGGKTVTLSQDSVYPWQGNIRITIGSRFGKDIRVRIPAWCKSWCISVNGNDVEPAVEKGYAVLKGRWNKGDVISLYLDMPVEMVAADPRTLEDEGLRAVQRGPLVYCLEGIDNPDYAEACISADTVFEDTYDQNLLGGVQAIKATTKEQVLNFIPYYSWDNREACPMKVWIPFAD